MLPFSIFPILHNFMAHRIRKRQKKNGNDETRVTSAPRQSQMKTKNKRKNKSADINVNIKYRHNDTNHTRCSLHLLFQCLHFRWGIYLNVLHTQQSNK